MDNGSLLGLLVYFSPFVGVIVGFLLVLTALPFVIGALIALVSAVLHAVRRILPGSRPEPSAEYPDQTALDPWQRLEALDTELSRQP
ncbi:MAG: hypothetical protein QOH55_1122 [Microbacteriaceae bacterium]|jgi:hypothetical protein|nr:hypothetical protein [Microbacteriaceae bacterium]